MKGITFAALDFETACGFNNICEIGVATVENGKVTAKYSWLVKPEGNEYIDENISIHGITPDMTKDSPSLKEVWPEVEKILNRYKVVVMHNAPFDRNLILKELYWLEENFPSCEYFCSYYISLYARKYNCENCKLGTLCDHFGISIEKQHRAGDDAKATAQLFLAEMNDAGVSTFEDLETHYMFKRGRFKPNYDFDPQERIYKGVKAKDIKGDPSLFISGHPFFGKQICFTGTMRDGNRTYCWQQIADIGGIPVDSVTKKTDYLIVGSLDREKTSKQIKAEKYISEGFSIQVISDEEYYNTIDSYNL